MKMKWRYSAVINVPINTKLFFHFAAVTIASLYCSHIIHLVDLDIGTARIVLNLFPLSILLLQFVGFDSLRT